MHDQDAYVVNQGVVGSFKLIGWEAPTSNYFTYTGSLADNATGNSATWTATPTTKGPTSCTGPWTITSTMSGTKAGHQANDVCQDLTPNFKFIGSSGTPKS